MTIPPVEELQLDQDSREKWINYAALDAKSTHLLHTVLRSRLLETPCVMDPFIQRPLGTRPAEFTMWDLYEKFWRPFGELLTDMEKEGMLVNRCCLADSCIVALA